MFTLGFNEFLRNIKKNLLIIIQLVIVYVVAIFVVSAFEEQYRLFGGVSNVFDDTGLLVRNTPAMSEELVTKEALEELLTGVETIEYSYHFNLIDEQFQLQNKTVDTIHISSSNPEHITYVPELIEGEWCEDASHEDGVINAVATNNFPFAVNIGDQIDYAGLRFKITGIVDTQEMLYGINSTYKVNELSYLDLYKSLNSDEYPTYMFIVSYKDLIRNSNIDLTPSTLWGHFTIIDFKDNITEEEISANIDKLIKQYGYILDAEIQRTDAIYNYSWQLIEIKVMPMLMLLFVIVLVLIISLIISSAINILYEKKNYGIYFICGNNWRNTFKFSTVSWSIVALTSLIIAVCACLIINSLNLFNGLALSFSWLHVATLLAITALLLVIAIIIPYFMIRKIQPVSILKENDK